MQAYQLNILDAARLIEAGQLSPVELTRSVLERARQQEDRISAYVALAADQAMADARQAEAEIRRGDYRGVLHGIPYTLKDLIDAAGLPTTASSRVRRHHLAAADSAVAARLRQAGMILTGKTHTHEFAFGLTTPQSNNPWAPERSPGGSSGGSAAAVAYGGALAALGTDTGGSIRVPAALCGLVGLKPTYDLVSRQGVVPLSGSLDHVGPIARTVADAAAILDAIAARPAAPAESYRQGLDQGVAGLRVGVPGNYFHERVAPEILAALREQQAELAAAGAVLVEVEIPLADLILPTQWGLIAPEAAAYHRDDLLRAPQLYGEEVRTLLEACMLVPDSDYAQARRARVALQAAWRRMFADIDLLLVPTVPHTAPLHGQDSFVWPDGSEESVASAYIRLSTPANVLGLPALTVPVGLDRAGLPFGAQLIGRPYDERTVLHAGQLIESSRQIRFDRPRA
ncbi:amidase [Chromobacterium sp. LK11]|uniref:amidase n=1 Tax=Chromobacterium sp. LK11 TaxID=1628212 RepID=UPI000652BC0C|nr:amidase [Chromobacterium sp. LK11]KMN81071.1 amidase [Chromobacterium sp. LK11]